MKREVKLDSHYDFSRVAGSTECMAGWAQLVVKAVTMEFRLVP